MGMAASQARFLSLTARKSNLEYEGQQINEQRTVLSNQSANLYNQMLTLSVPVPPSSENYTELKYTFTVPGSTSASSATINQITKITTGTNAGMYSIAFSYTEKEMGFPACSTDQKVKVKTYDSDAHTASIETSKGEKSLTWFDPNNPVDEHKDAYDTLCAATNDQLYYVNVGTDYSPVYEYFKGSELKTAQEGYDDGKRCTYYKAGEIDVANTGFYSPCTINRDGNNRVTSFTYDDEEIAVSTLTVTNEEAYNDAYNEYVYQTYLYEQQMNEINAQTSIIQEQDRTLELRLKQLDTEHNAVDTERDAVKSIIDKNVESSFKTFA